MESEFGTYFLSNYRSAELVGLLNDAKETQTPAPTAASAASAAKPPAPSTLPPLQRLCDSESTATPGSSGLFRLAPPPPPTNQFSVGATRTSADVVKIETLQEQKAAATASKTQELEDYGPTGAVFVDDEESLLGDDAPKTGGEAGLVGTKHTRDLDSDVEVDEADIASPQAKAMAAPHLDPPVELPPPQALSPAEAEDEVEEELEEKPIETASGLELHVTVAPPQEVPQLPPPRPSPVHHAPPLPAAPDAAGVGTAETPAEASSRPILPGHVQTFRISVPQPFPGVQLRRSPKIDDKHDRFLQDGKEVRGKVDATGEWVKLKSKHYLPVKVGQIQVLHPVETHEEPTPASPEVLPVEEDPSFWWSCCAGSAVIASIEANDLHVAPQDRAAEREHDGLEGEMPVSPVTNKMVTGGAPTSKAPASLRPEAPTVVDLPRHISHPIDPFSDR